MILGNSGVSPSGRELPAEYQLAGLETLDPASQDLYFDEMRALLGGLYDLTFDKFLAKVRTQEDRRAEVVLDASSRCCGTLIYKSDLVEKEIYWDMSNGDDVKVYDAFEIKTLALFDPERDGHKGIGAYLLQRAESYAVDKQARGIVLVVSTTKPWRFFSAHGYSYVLTRREYDRNGIHEDAGAVMYKALRDGGLDTKGRIFS